jgi:hypothetical protein
VRKVPVAVASAEVALHTTRLLSYICPSHAYGVCRVLVHGVACRIRLVTVVTAGGCSH